MNRDLEWQRRYEENDTPWDKGAPAPALAGFLLRQPLTGRVLVPGCGRGHDVQALAEAGATVVGLDFSPLAVKQAKELAANAPYAGRIEFVLGDFFKLPPAFAGSFDWMVEHTCLSAIEPHLRPDYVRSAAYALKPGGKIFGIFFTNPDVETGPPFRISKEELSALLDPHFTLLEEWVPKECFPGREGRELIRILQKT
jgi:SAM-dependent methyltransferase